MTSEAATIPSVSLSRMNTLLLVCILILNGYVIIAPFVPSIIFDIQAHSGREQQLSASIAPKGAGSKSGPTTALTSQSNQLIIPSMLLDQPIYEGPDYEQYTELNKGIWRYHNGSTPALGGNTVLVGHRFTYTNPRGVFYFLNKVQTGDQLAVIWNHVEYLYRVSTVTVVAPSDTAIEAPTSGAQLTLFTCTPLLLPTQRLVVVASLEHTL